MQKDLAALRPEVLNPTSDKTELSYLEELGLTDDEFVIQWFDNLPTGYPPVWIPEAKKQQMIARAIDRFVS